jgi:Alternative complex III, ActD subunit
MNAVYALYDDPDAAQRAVNGLYAAGVAEDNVVVMSGEPFEAQPFAHRDSATWLWYIACLGGLIGLSLATWLTRMTELAWPLQTGNMPIVAWWPNMIVMFELMMLGAILATVITLFITAKLPSRVPPLYDPEVTNGKILVGVQNPSAASLPALERALLAGGTAELKRS